MMKKIKIITIETIIVIAIIFIIAVIDSSNSIKFRKCVGKELLNCEELLEKQQPQLDCCGHGVPLNK